MPRKPKDPEQLITPEALALRWKVSTITLRNWRSIGRGPAFCHVGHRVRYRLGDVCQFEGSHKFRKSPTRAPSSEPA